MEADFALIDVPATWDRDTDLSLLEAARAMNKEAITGIFDRYSHAIYNYALRLCKDPLTADHIVGDVFAKFLDQLAAKKGPTTNLRSYLFQITYHIIVDQARASHRQAPLELAQCIESSGQTLLAACENRLILERLLKSMQNDLTEGQRNVIILRFIEGFTLVETAEIMRITVDNVKVIQNRGLAGLRKALANYF